MKIERMIKMWQRRNPSLYGKIIICKTFLLSQISYIIQALALPDHVINRIDTLLFKFLWQKRFSNKKAREKVRRSVLCKPIEEGGLNMISLKDQQKVCLLKWIKKLIKEENTTRFLGIQVDDRLSWQSHINVIKTKISKILLFSTEQGN